VNASSSPYPQTIWEKPEIAQDDLIVIRGGGLELIIDQFTKQAVPFSEMFHHFERPRLVATQMVVTACPHNS
jgi:hypothetical protein